MRPLEEIIKDLPENIRLPIYEAFQVFKEDIIHKDLEEIKKEIKEVWEVIRELTEAQKRTEERVEKLAIRVEELAEAQKRTEKRVEELAEAQKRTEERIEELAEAQKRTEKRVEELAEAQKRTEERIEELAEAQKRTEKRVEELAEAQKRTEEELKKLIEEHSKTREQLGGLSHAFGYVLEDRAIKSLPKIFEKYYGIQIIGELKREYIEIDGEYVEVNIYGKAKKNDKEYILIGEAKSRVSKKIIDEFLMKCEKISKESIKVLVSYIFPPEIKKYAEEKQIILISSYQLEL
jgi:DNA repair exonuclease SbcCD ATPase subunit